MTPRTICLIAAAAFALLSRQPAWGQLLAECRGDVNRFCASMPMGGGNIIHCLEENAARLSKGCKQAIGVKDPEPAGEKAEGAPGGAASAKTACRSDAMRFCADAVGDQPKMKGCMRAHAKELSCECKTAMVAGEE